MKRKEINKEWNVLEITNAEKRKFGKENKKRIRQKKSKKINKMTNQ